MLTLFGVIGYMVSGSGATNMFHVTEKLQIISGPRPRYVIMSRKNMVYVFFCRTLHSVPCDTVSPSFGNDQLFAMGEHVVSPIIRG